VPSFLDSHPKTKTLLLLGALTGCWIAEFIWGASFERKVHSDPVNAWYMYLPLIIVPAIFINLMQSVLRQPTKCRKTIILMVTLNALALFAVTLLAFFLLINADDL
jgi:hypothetical protein